MDGRAGASAVGRPRLRTRAWPVRGACHARGTTDSLPAIDALRRQNPHMHLFEALLNLWTNARDARYLNRAGKLFELFSRRFFQPDLGVVIEYFDQALAPAPGIAGTIVEPGHQCE